MFANEGLELWERAKKVIPGGNGLLSKRPERHLPDLWPTYYSHAEGVDIWDLEGNKYVDVSYMGIGTVVLGYCDKDVDNAVKTVIDKGINTTLNAPEELYLAERLLELNPFAGGVKFARSGAEAMAIAVRIARAYTGREKIAFSGYHGWSDWYLAANIADENNLSGHLLSGLGPAGVPKQLLNTALPFKYNNAEDLKKLLNTHSDIGVIVIEGARYDLPSEEFIEAINEEAQKRNIVVICDEITSGMRVSDGGVYKTISLNPDIVVFGKGLGNGYAISAIVGKQDVMSAAQDTFISSTFWTERVGFAAALATLTKICDNKVWESLMKKGEMVSKGWLTIARKHSLKIKVTDFKPLVSMKFEYGEDNIYIETFMVQEMLKRGYLAASCFYVSYSHTDEIINKYLNELDEVFEIMAKHIADGTVKKALETRVKEQGFKRLN